MNICIIIPQTDIYSETFIQNHIDYLDFNKYVLYGTDLTKIKYNERYLLKKNLTTSLNFKLFRNSKKKIAEKNLIKFLLFNKIDCILAEYAQSGILVADIAFKLKIPLIVHFHGYDASVYSLLNDNRKAYLKMFERSSAIISVSLSMSERLINLGAESRKIFYNCYGIDTDLFVKSERPLNNMILCVGRFVEKKAPHLSILAFYRAYLKFNKMKLVMVGDGPLLDACQELVKALKIQDVVIFKGVCGQTELVEIHKNADFLIQHSVIAPNGNAEGTPLSILEALASGLPVISTKHEGITQVVRNGYNGFLVEEYDIEDMAIKILELVNNNNLLLEQSLNARRTIEENYTLESSINSLNRIIKTVCN